MPILSTGFFKFLSGYFQTPFYALVPAIPYLDPALIFLLYTISSPLPFGERLQKRKFTLDYPHWIWYYIRCIQYAYAPVAQLDRALDSDSKGRAFEPHRAYQIRRHDESRAFLFYSEDRSPLAAASSSSGRSLRLPISALSFYYDRYYKRRSFPMERDAPFFVSAANHLQSGSISLLGVCLMLQPKGLQSGSTDH